MDKTPEELAKDYCGSIVSTDYVRGAARENWVDIQRRVAGEERVMSKAFLAGYQAAKDKYEVKLKEVSANWTFCCKDKARLLQELTAKEDICQGTRQFISEWISVKDRLPENILDVLILNKENNSCVGYYRSKENDWNMYNQCCSFHMGLHGVTHWMLLLKPPTKEDKL